LTIKLAPLEIHSSGILFMAPCCLFTRRLIVKELISGCTGNKKLIFELFVSGTATFPKAPAGGGKRI
jgi:hypothetical protein